MTDLPTLSGPRLGPDSGEAKKLVVLLHGYGANGEDLIGLAPAFAQVLPGVRATSTLSARELRPLPGGCRPGSARQAHRRPRSDGEGRQLGPDDRAGPAY